MTSPSLRNNPTRRDSFLRHAGTNHRLKLFFLVAFLGLLGLAAAVVFLLPSHVTTSSKKPTPEEADKAANPNSSVVKDQIAARAQSEALLSETLRRMARLESEGARVWGMTTVTTSLPDIETTLKKANGLYDQQKYALSLPFFQEAISKFNQLEASRVERFRVAMSDGQMAITALNAATAIKQFEIATALKPGSEQAQAALTRARILPAVLSNMADGRKLESSGDIDGAAKKYETAASLDRQHRPAQENLLRIKKIISDRDYQDAVTQVLTLIEQKNLKGAARALKRAQNIRPNTSEIIEIRQRLKTATVNATLKALHENALSNERQEKWSQALTVYKKALSIDKNAAFAQRGKRRAQRQVKLHHAIDLYLTNPARLQSPEPMAHAKALLGETNPSADSGRLLRSKRQRLGELIVLAETPVSVVLRSDGKTTVILYRVGKMGRFDIREIKLKPGRYTATGSRSGFRDVRLVFRVTPESQNLDFRIECTEPIGR